MNTIHCGDNLTIMHSMPDNSVDLIYLDPPFFSGRNYEVIWGDEAEVRSFSDRREGGMEVYLEWMIPRLKAMHRILKPTGSIYIHCDWHAGHYIKVMLDKVFGYNNFRNEIIWCYTGPSNTKRWFPRKHDTIFFYSKSNEYTFNIDSIRIPYVKLNTGKTKGIFKSEATLSKKGKVPEDWWDEQNDGMTTIGRLKNERLGYPTQKPEALLERIIKASSNKGDIVFDPFAGCGTCTSVAQKLDRQYIAIDISPIACKLISKRVNHPDDIIGYPHTPDEIGAMEPHEFQNWVCEKLSARNTSKSAKKPSGGDGGIDGIIHTPVTNPKYHESPIQVKQSSSVGVNTVRNFFAAMHDVKKETGFIVALSFGKGAKEQVAKYKNEGSVTIHLLTLQDIIETKSFKEIVSMLNE